MLVLFVYAESDYCTHLETVDRVRGIFLWQIIEVLFVYESVFGNGNRLFCASEEGEAFRACS